jgi:hypothetical protein
MTEPEALMIGIKSLERQTTRSCSDGCKRGGDRIQIQ